MRLRISPENQESLLALTGETGKQPTHILNDALKVILANLRVQSDQGKQHGKTNKK